MYIIYDRNDNAISCFEDFEEAVQCFIENSHMKRVTLSKWQGIECIDLMYSGVEGNEIIRL